MKITCPTPECSTKVALFDVMYGGGVMLHTKLECSRCGLSYELRHWMAPTWDDAIFGIISGLMYNGFIPPPPLETLIPRFELWPPDLSAFKGLTP